MIYIFKGDFEYGKFFKFFLMKCVCFSLGVFNKSRAIFCRVYCGEL